MRSSLIITLIFSLLMSYFSHGSTMVNSHDNIHTMIQLPSSFPHSAQGGQFASGTIDLGRLLVTHATSFKKVWSTHEGGPDNLGITFYDPVAIPHGFSSLGSYSQPNNIPLFGHILVAKDVSNNPFEPILKSPIDYELKWTSHFLNLTKDGEGYVWLPIAPHGYKAIGYVITREYMKPPLDKVSCVHASFVDDTTKKSSPNGATKVAFESQNFIDLNGLNVHGSMGGFKIENESLGKLQGNAMNSMPNMTQINVLITTYSPVIYFHPDEEYFPSSVDWFFENGALLHHTGELNAFRIGKNGWNLPQGGLDDETYWIDLPEDDVNRERVKKGDLQTVRAYFHIKPVSGGLFTDISVWTFYPFNGPSTIKVLSITKHLKKMGEHIGDWEHVTLRISNVNGELNSVYFAQHGWGEWVSASALEWDANGKIVVYSSLHHHASYSKPGNVLYGWKGKHVVGMLDMAGSSDKFMDTGVGAVVVAAEYLGGVVVEPPWLNYMRKWGPKIDYQQVQNVLRSIKNSLVFFLRGLFEKLIQSLPKELLGEDGPTGPKAKNSWNGDEELRFGQLIKGYAV